MEFNVQTGETSVIPLTPEELAEAAIAKAAEDEYNLPDNKAIRAIDATDRLWFEVNFNQENRLRTLEGRPSVTKAQYRDALIAAYKAL